MGEIVPIVSQQAAEDAWEAYASLARLTADNPKLLLDREHFHAMTRARRRYEAIFLRLDERA